MLSSTQIKDIVSEARPIIERQLDDAERIAAFRDVVSASGGDWSALKALIKAQIQDERDETGDGKRVRKILEKADFSTGYADMLGWSNMNEKNFSAEPHDPETGEILESVQSHEAAVVSEPAGSASGEISEPNTSVESRERQKAGEPVSKPEATPKERSLPSVGPSGTAASNSNPQPVVSDQYAEANTAIGLAGPACAHDDAAANTKPAQISSTFTNPKCLNPKTCLGVHSKTACHDCVMAYAQRPPEEQKRLWAEAMGAAAA